jgi:hypothetical protein
MPTISVDDALDGLSRRRMVSVGQACRRLSDALDSVRILSLYKQYFPRQYARSPSPMLIAGDERYTEREYEFFRLVNQHLFPLPDEVMDDWPDNQRDEYIPLTPMGIDWTENLDEWSFPVQVLATLAMGTEASDEMLDAIGPGTPGPIGLGGDHVLNWNCFASLCRRAGGLMAWVPAALEVVGHDTGILWLDITFESLDACPLYLWTLDGVKELAAEWRKAKKMLDKTQAVLDWLEPNPRPLAQVIEFWNRSMEVKRERQLVPQ